MFKLVHLWIPPPTSCAHLTHTGTPRPVQTCSLFSLTSIGKLEVGLRTKNLFVSGVPAEVLMPAPVKTTQWEEFRIMPAILSASAVTVSYESWCSTVFIASLTIDLSALLSSILSALSTGMIHQVQTSNSLRRLHYKQLSLSYEIKKYMLGLASNK